MICENCNKIHDGSYGSGRFCSNFCARSFSRKKVQKGKKEIICFVCKTKITVNKHAPNNKTYCDKCKKNKILQPRKCTICGQKPCKRQNICRKYKVFPSLSKYFGFDNDKIGTQQVYEEFDRIKLIIFDQYYNQEMSVPEMFSIYNHEHLGSFSKILESIGIKFRKISAALNISYRKGRKTPHSVKSVYKHGWHRTWNNNHVFYRSSYELEFAKQLDNKHVLYEMERLRIAYWDSQTGKMRIAIPDFFLPATNEIVEIKSEWTLNEKNMIDKIKAYQKHGYNFKLLVDKKEKTLI